MTALYHVTALDKDLLYYFAMPYSSTDVLEQETRYLQGLAKASELLNMGYTLLEPIAMSHQHAQRFGLPSHYGFWKTRDRKFIERSDAVLIYALPGWDKSVGVTDETAHAFNLIKPVYLLTTDNKIKVLSNAQLPSEAA